MENNIYVRLFLLKRVPVVKEIKEIMLEAYYGERE